jgi:hypothetical protein
MAHPLLGEDSGSSETTARIVVYEEGKSAHKILRSHPSLNNDPSLCATLYMQVVFASSTSGDQHF